MPSEEEEDEVNRGMRTEQIAEMINRQQLHIRKNGQPVTSNQVYAVICRFPDMFIKEQIGFKIINNFVSNLSTNS